jgi:hypothetical protein
MRNADPGWKKSDQGSGIKILDPQHCHTAKKSCLDLENYLRYKIYIKATNPRLRLQEGKFMPVNFPTGLFHREVDNGFGTVSYKAVLRIRIRIFLRPLFSGSGSFYYQAKLVRKTLIPTVL